MSLINARHPCSLMVPLPQLDGAPHPLSQLGCPRPQCTFAPNGQHGRRRTSAGLRGATPPSAVRAEGRGPRERGVAGNRDSRVQEPQSPTPAWRRGDLSRVRSQSPTEGPGCCSPPGQGPGLPHGCRTAHPEPRQTVPVGAGPAPVCVGGGWLEGSAGPGRLSRVVGRPLWSVPGDLGWALSSMLHVHPTHLAGLGLLPRLWQEHHSRVGTPHRTAHSSQGHTGRVSRVTESGQLLWDPGLAGTPSLPTCPPACCCPAFPGGSLCKHLGSDPGGGWPRFRCWPLCLLRQVFP